MTDQETSESSIFESDGSLLLLGAGHRLSPAVVDKLRAIFPDVVEELQLYWDTYQSWKTEGQLMDRALLEIWHMAEPSDTSHMSYGEDAEIVVSAVRAALRRQRSELIEREIETFELVIDSSENLGAEEFAGDSRNTDPQWEAGYRAGAADLADYLRQKVTGLRAAQAELTGELQE